MVSKTILLAEMGDTRAVYGIYKRNLKHLVVPESKKRNALLVKQNRKELKQLLLAKAGKI